MDQRPLWLQAAKARLLETSSSVGILRARIANELRSRVLQLAEAEYNRNHLYNQTSKEKVKSQENEFKESSGANHLLAKLPRHQREALIRDISDIVLSEAAAFSTSSSTHAVNGMGTETEAGSLMRSLWTDITSEAEILLDDHLGTAVAAQLMEARKVAGADSLDDKIKIAQKESENAIMSLLSKCPDARISLRGCVNVPLSRDLRRVAWLACLSDNDIVKDFYRFVNSNRVERNLSLTGSSLFNACQNVLGSSPTLYPLASQFRVVKRMEQALAFLIHESSVPHLRHLNLAIKPLSKWSPTSDVSSENETHPDLVEFQHADEGSLRRRQMMFMAPFLKVLELDDNEIQAMTSYQPKSSKPRMDNEEDLDEDAEYMAPAKLLAKAAEGESKDWLNVFYANEHLRKKRRKKCGARLEIDEARTARLAEVFSRFWALIPFNWREEGDLMIQVIAAEAESYLHNEDPDLHSHLAKLLAQKNGVNDFSGFTRFAKHLIGDIFVGKCELSVLCYIFDQLIIASFESTRDEKFPSMDSLCAWMCSCMILLMRDKILICRTIDELLPLTALHQSAFTVNVLSTAMESHFLSKFRNSLTHAVASPPPFIDLPSHIFGYDETISSLTPAEKKSPDMYAKISLHLTNARRQREGLPLVGQDNAQLMNEMDLVFAETEEYALLKEFYVVKKRKERRLRELMSKWIRLGKCLGTWAVYFKRVKRRMLIKAQKRREKERIEAERLRQIQLEEEFARRQADQDLAMDSSLFSRLIDNNGDDQNHIYGVWGDDAGENDDDEALNFKQSQDSFGLNNDPMFAEEVKRQEALRLAEMAEAERKRKQMKRPDTVTRSLTVTVGTFVGEEQLHLTRFGKLLQSVMDKTQYVLQGYFKVNPTSFSLMAHALSFQRQFEKDMAIVLKKGQLSRSIVQELSILRPSKQRRILNSIEQLRIRRMASILSNTRTTVNEKMIMNALEDKTFVDGSSEFYALQTLDTNIHNSQKKLTQRFSGVVLSVLEKLKTVIEGEPETRDPNWLLALQAERKFKQAEREAWNTVMGPTADFSHNKVRAMLEGGVSTSNERDEFLKKINELL
ncbi:hypothetical protein BC830DRAFT_1119975 [Chytriomyces sp. MP71]|nr:hypothetical protein BC830DRAFT_1119975 [Chytriomyces sp. MP71]